MLLCPSLMCADYGNLRATVEDLDAAGIDIFHCDVMDGSFVPNFAMGLEEHQGRASCHQQARRRAPYGRESCQQG